MKKFWGFGILGDFNFFWQDLENFYIWERVYEDLWSNNYAPSNSPHTNRMPYPVNFLNEHNSSTFLQEPLSSKVTNNTSLDNFSNFS